MSNLIKLTQLLPYPLFCFLLQIDESKILLDIGWDTGFSVEALAGLREIVKSVDLVLLTHAKLSHLGAYGYARSHLGLTCRALATQPIQSLGRIATLDAFDSLAPRKAPCSTDEVNKAFEDIQTVRYKQPVTLLDGVTLTAYAAGHTVGGTIWKISKESDNIVYLAEFNHKQERLLDGSALLTKCGVLDALSRPSLLIADASTALLTHTPRKKRESQLFSAIKHTLTAGGNILIPVDSSARVLSLAHLLEQHWRQCYHHQFPLVLLSHHGHKALQYSKSMLEFFGNNMILAFSTAKEHPLEFRHLKVCNRYIQLHSFQGPKAVLASIDDLEAGFSRRLFLTWCKGPKNTILLTSRGAPGSTCRRLYDLARASPDGVVNAGECGYQLSIPIHFRVPLRGDDLLEHLRQERERRAADERRRAMAEELASPNDDDEDMEDEEEDLANPEAPEEADLWRTRFDVFLKQNNSKQIYYKRQFQTFTLFPHFEPKTPWDEYGDVIDPDQYMTEYDRLTLTQQQQPLQMQRPPGQTADSPNINQELAEDVIDDDAYDEPHQFSQDEISRSVATKVVTKVKRVDVACRIVAVESEGLSDGRSLCTIIPQLSPKKVVLFHGSVKDNEVLRDAIQSQDPKVEIRVASPNETLQLSSTSHIYQLKLTERLLTSLRGCPLGDYEVAFVAGTVHKRRDVAVLDIDEEGASSSHKPLLVGDVKLGELRGWLESIGYRSQLGKGGVLAVFASNSKSNPQKPLAVIRKNLEGKVKVDGSGLHKDYFKIRDLVYSQLVSL